MSGIRTRFSLLCCNPDIMGAASWVLNWSLNYRTLTPLVITNRLPCHSRLTVCVWALCLCCCVIAQRFTTEPVWEQLRVVFVLNESMDIPRVDVNLFDSCQSHQVQRLQTPFRLMDSARDVIVITFSWWCPNNCKHNTQIEL